MGLSLAVYFDWCCTCSPSHWLAAMRQTDSTPDTGGENHRQWSVSGMAGIMCGAMAARGQSEQREGAA